MVPDFLLAAALAVFTILWAADLLLTRRTVAALDASIELNPLMRLLLTKRDSSLYLVKGIELAAFGYLIYYVSMFAEETAFYILLGYIVVFGLLVANNARVYQQVTTTVSPVYMTTFMLMVLVVVSFIYLNYALFDDLQHAYDEVDNCRQNLTVTQSACGSNTELTDATATPAGNSIRLSGGTGGISP